MAILEKKVLDEFHLDISHCEARWGARCLLQLYRSCLQVSGAVHISLNMKVCNSTYDHLLFYPVK